jgi:serine/threonine protein kinase
MRALYREAIAAFQAGIWPNGRHSKVGADGLSWLHSLELGVSMSDDRVGTSFAGYHIKAQVAVGGMGMVYEATAPDGARVALKIAKNELAADETFRRRFEREANIAKTVRHPHVVSALDSGEYEGLPFMTQVFIDGMSLQRKLAQVGRLPVREIVSICLQVGDGLQAMYDAGLVHRDVKPGNILLERSGKAYITDFGLAKDNAGSILTEPGQALGSLDYMAPEQIRGEGVTAAADVYSLGCVAYECLYGKRPYADRPGLLVLWAHLQDDPPDPPVEWASPEFVRALRTGLAKQVEDRPPRCIDYARALARAADISLTSVSV